MMKSREDFYRNRFFLRACCVVAMFCCIWSNLANAQNPTPTPTTTPVPTKTPAQQINLKESLEKSLAADQETMKQLEKHLTRAQQFEKDIETELNAYKIQISAYNSVLLAPDTPIEELEKVRENAQTSLKNIAARLKELNQEKSALEQQRVKTEEQYTLNQKQLNEIQTDSSKKPSADPETKVLLEKLQELTDLLSEKRSTLEDIQSIYTGLITRLEEIQRDFTTVSEKFDTQIEERKKRELFERKTDPFAFLGGDQVSKELRQLAEQVQRLLSIEFWRQTFQTIWTTEGFILIRFILFLAIAVFLLLRFRRFFTSQIEKIPCDQFPWRCLVLKLLERSLPLFGATGFLYLYTQFGGLRSTATLIHVLTHILVTLLFSRWMLGFLKLWRSRREDSSPLKLVFLIRFLITFARYFVITYVLIEWALGSSSVVLLLGRVVFEIGVFIWSLVFWERFRETPEQIFPGQPQTRQVYRSLTIGLGYIIASAGLLIELAGYGPFARYWYVSWGKTMVLLLWGFLSFRVLREWERGIQDISQTDQEKLEKTAHQLQWLIARLSWVVLPALTIIGLLLAWGAKQYVLVGTVTVLTYSIPIGGLNLRLLGFIYAILILLCTHVATRLWRRVLKEKVLVNSGLEKGVQASITTISSYLLWLFGILWALNALGVGTTSLTVGFGALGIGLGFGLQSIFNNFMSGLILLFDRSIEVGDIIEINGKWGFIEKINVRSTIFRTYDNAAIIIPNSEILSTQLTNWTFKDVRVRRTITVGVAYGSDVRLVEKTLYEIAEKHPRVLTEPAPMVLFTDFANSSLNFKLWVWTLLEYGLTTETDIRFEIDRLFRERNIEIPFPQSDLHIRSGLEKVFSDKDPAENEVIQEQENNPLSGNHKPSDSD